MEVLDVELVGEDIRGDGVAGGVDVHPPVATIADQEVSR